MKTYVLNHDKSTHTEQNPTEMPKTQFEGSEFVLVKTCIGITTSQPNKSTHTDEKPTELPRTQSAEEKKVLLHFWFSLVLQKCGGEK